MAIPELKDAKERLTDCIYFGDPLSASVGTGFVPTNRQINTTAPLGGGGDLSTNRTLTISEFAGTTPGSVPTSVGGVTTFLRADGSWAVPPTFGAAAPGYAPASGGGSTNYLRADGTWAAPPGAGIAGLTANFYPVATSATSIGDGRIVQSANALSLCTDFTDVNNYNAFNAMNAAAGTTFTLFPIKVVAGVVQDCTLQLLAGNGTANITLSGAVIAATGDTTVTGKFALTESAITLANGLNSNVSLTGKTTHLRATGPTGAFSVGGFTGVTDGQQIVLHNTTAQAMTIVNEDASSTAANRIYTGTGANVVLPAYPSIVTFWYSAADARWIYAGSSQAAQPTRTLGYIPYQNSSAVLADSTLFHDSANNRYGFATATPKTTVDVNGSFGVRQSTLTLANGLNSNVTVTSGFARVTGPTFAFSIGGIVAASGEDGRIITIFNRTSQTMNIAHEDASSTAANRINTLTGGTISLPSGRQSCVTLQYSAVDSRWTVIGANPLNAASPASAIQFNNNGALLGDAGLLFGGTGGDAYITLGTDAVLARKATRHFQLGASLPPANADYTLTGQCSLGGTHSNKIGGDLRVGGGAGTGTAGGGDTILVAAYPTVAGNTQNSFADRVVIAAKPVTLAAATATTVLTVGVPTETGSGGTLTYTLYATDGTDMQIRRGRLPWGAVNKASAITVVLGTPEEVDCTPTGTLTVTITALDNSDDTFSFQFDAASSLTETTLETWISLEHDGKGAVTTI